MRRSKNIDNAASRFNQRIRLERPVISQDSIGDTLTTWVLIDEVWADISPISGRELLKNYALREVVTHRVYLRYRSDIDTSCRIVYGSRLLKIHSIIYVGEEKRLLKLRVEES